MATTLYDKIWQAHLVDAKDVKDAEDANNAKKTSETGEEGLIYIDRHLIHEVTTPQAFAGLDEKNRKVRCIIALKLKCY